MSAALVTLQNLRGPGVGCPAASTTFVAQQRAIQDGPDTPAVSSPPVAPASPPPPVQGPASVPPADTSVAALAPSLGFQSGVNPTGPCPVLVFFPNVSAHWKSNPSGTGDCDGAVNGPDGRPIKIPCACPPDQSSFIDVSVPSSSRLTGSRDRMNRSAGSASEHRRGPCGQ